MYKREAQIMEKFIPLSIPNFEGNEKKYVLDAVEQGWVSTGGAYITMLENKLAEYLNIAGAVACQSGTSALHLALMECNVGPGDMVIVPTLTFIAAVNPVKYQFATPIFMDCDDSLCMDPIKLEQFCRVECEIKKDVLVHKKTGQIIKAVVIVHVFGNLANMERIMEIADTYHLKVIEDATEALGSRFLEGKYRGKMAGTIGDFGAYSFNGNKIITTGGGGAVVAQDEEKLEHIKYISTQAKDDAIFYVHKEIGYNYRMTNLQAALGVAQLENLPEFIERKNRNYDFYQECFENMSIGKLLPFREGTYSNKWFYAFEILGEITKKKSVKEIVQQLDKKGVQTRPIWGLIHEQWPYKDEEAYKIDKAEYYRDRIINIPCSTCIGKEEIETVAAALRDVLNTEV